jgi:polyadenylate-binding protein
MDKRAATSTTVNVDPLAAPAIGAPAPAASVAAAAAAADSASVTPASAPQAPFRRTPQKEMLGEVLFPRVFAREPAVAGKITGMLLELPDEEVMCLLDSPVLFAKMVAEAKEVLLKADYIPE